jgi:hypothetical protein
VNAKFAYERMREGPYLEDFGVGGPFIVIPSDWYREEAKEYWAKAGFTFRYLDGLPSWVRSTDRPWKDRKFTPMAWLKWARDRFYDFFGSELCQHGDLVLKKDFVREGLSDKDG